MRILVTGSEGLIGSALRLSLSAIGCIVVPFDIRRSPAEDVRNAEALALAARDVDGIVHLAAVSRVLHGEQDPEKCWAVNEGSIQHLADICLRRNVSRPCWLIFASSREVYGQQSAFPVAETAELRPMNVYARTKVAGERKVREMRDAGIVANVLRLSNVYGDIRDHSDRVVPAFARAAALGGAIRIDDREGIFDFTHVSDVVRGLTRMVERTSTGWMCDPLHLVTGRGTSLGRLGALARQHSRGRLDILEGAPRNFDVARFFGCPEQAHRLLDWRAEILIEDGFARLVDDFMRE